MFIVQITFFPPTRQEICWAGAGRQFKQAQRLHFWVIVATFRRQFVNHYYFPLCMQVLFKALRYQGSDFQRPRFSARAALLKIKPQALYNRLIQGKKNQICRVWESDLSVEKMKPVSFAPPLHWSQSLYWIERLRYCWLLFLVEVGDGL